MMYADKFAAAIKCGRAFLREFKDITYVPFGSEYSIYLKNLNNVRALVNITIDGKSATDGVNLMLQPNSEAVLERFIKNGNFKEGNCFKFIERTQGVEQHRGISAEDGLIRIEYWFEKEYPEYDPNWYKPKPWVRRKQDWWLDNNVEYRDDDGGEVFCSGAAGAMGDDTLRSVDRGISSTATYSANNIQTKSFVAQNRLMKSASIKKFVDTGEQNEVGVTAPGSVSNQSFHEASWFPTETQSHVIVLRLLGETEEGRRVSKPVTTRMKSKCVSCGHVNKTSNKCCSECGTSLIIII